MAQQIIPADQLVPKFQGIGRCNNYVVLQSIPCSPECKIIGKILLDHPLSYALTATADIPAILSAATTDNIQVIDKKSSKGSRRLLEYILVSWDGYQLICRWNTLRIEESKGWQYPDYLTTL
ncbi:hypothetical protein Tco_0667378 [Tanacetum coccineum]